MKKEITVTAKTTELALEKAARELGAPSVEAIQYTVIEKEKKGFLGIGSSAAIITASYGRNGEDIAVDFLKTLLRDMQIEGEITVSNTDNADKLICIDGKDVGILIGHRYPSIA